MKKDEYIMLIAVFLVGWILRGIWQNPRMRASEDTGGPGANCTWCMTHGVIGTQPGDGCYDCFHPNG